MAKESGLGANLYVDGYELGGDIGSLSGIGWSRALLDVTPISKSAPERIPGLGDAALGYMSFFNDAEGQAHPVLRNPPATDSIHVWTQGSAIGDVAGAIVAKRADYSPSRAADGAFTINTTANGNGYSLDFAQLLTAGKRTDTTATNGTSLDGGAATTTGWAAYLQVVALTGTNVIVTIQDSADNSSFAAVTSGAFTSVTSAPGKQRIAGAAGATLKQYVRAVTTGTFTSATFVVVITRSPAAL